MKSIKISKNINYLNFASIYAVEGEVDIPKSINPCFARIFSGYSSDSESLSRVVKNKYTLYLRDPKEDSDNNDVIITEEQIKEYLAILNVVVPEAEMAISFPKEVGDEYIITIDIESKLFIHKWLLSALRLLYERPFSICLKEAFEFRDHPDFKHNVDDFKSIFILYQIVYSMYSPKGESSNRLFHTGVVSMEYSNIKTLRGAIEKELNRKVPFISNIGDNINLHRVISYLSLYNYDHNLEGGEHSKNGRYNNYYSTINKLNAIWKNR